MRKTTKKKQDGGKKMSKKVKTKSLFGLSQTNYVDFTTRESKKFSNDSMFAAAEVERNVLVFQMTWFVTS